jgi:hypothetical protein
MPINKLGVTCQDQCTSFFYQPVAYSIEVYLGFLSLNLSVCLNEGLAIKSGNKAKKVLSKIEIQWVAVSRSMG